MNAILNLSPEGKMRLISKQCFWCGKTVSTLAVKEEDIKQHNIPGVVVRDYEPCPECSKKMNDGITIMAVSTIPLRPNQPPLPKKHMTDQPDDLYPIGKWAVIDESTAQKYFKNQPDALQLMLQTKLCCVSDDIFNKIIPQIPADKKRK